MLGGKKINSLKVNYSSTCNSVINNFSQITVKFCGYFLNTILELGSSQDKQGVKFKQT